MGVSAPAPSASRPFNHKRTGVQQQVLPPEAERDGDFVRVRARERGEAAITHQECWTPGVLALFRLRKSQHKCSEIVVISRIAFRRRTSYLSEGHGVDTAAINRPRRTITAAPARQHPARCFRQPPGCKTPVPWLPLPWHR
jgi:hypothetical protein